LVGQFQNVIVPSGGHCLLQDSEVRGNVKALENARLLVQNVIVWGNVEGHKAASVQVVGSTVHGNIKIVKAGDPIFNSAVVSQTTLPNGNILIEKGRFPFADWIVAFNTLEKGSIQVVKNGRESPGFPLPNFIFGNHVARDVKVLKNFGSEEKVVADNTIDGNLQCRKNTGPFSSFGNFVGGSALGQCAGGLASASASVSLPIDLSKFPLRRPTD
jgi:hypothetical protein